ncbi:MAG: DegT/DnrJ/EryC1/StrS family aminotransferase [Candidatus Omnitrophica bacterium]|nr:DegT/DnrJ/EryC1/StrS family aminotransferase [Candidatus Omnitrophota bacterium]
MRKEIYLDAPNVGLLEKEYLCKSIDSTFVSTFGKFVPEFEKGFAKYLRINNAVSTQSGTAAIHMALRELQIGKGDEVIVPVSTFVATVNPVVYVGACPVFVDVEPATWNMSPLDIKKKITKKTKAIIPVHLYGNPCNMDEIMHIAQSHGLRVIEDAAESLGAKYNGKFTGTFGDMGCFSFNGNKIITTGGGGMVVGSDAKKIAHIKLVINQANDGCGEYYHPEIGYNYRMTNLEAVLGLAQMTKLKTFLAKKRKFNAIYRKELKKINMISFQEELNGANSSHWLTCIIFNKDIDILKLQKRLKDKGIQTRRTFKPLVEFPPYVSYNKGKYENSYNIYSKGLCLPGSTLNNEEEINYVCRTLKKEIAYIVR